MPTCSALPFGRVGNIESIFGARGFKSAKRFEDACRIKTAMLNFGRFCWKDKFRSTVMKTSNSFAARVRRSPFLMPDHPICGTVLISCPAKSLESRRSMHSSKEASPYATILMICSSASSRIAITCSLDTVGNPSKKSSMDSPALR